MSEWIIKRDELESTIKLLRTLNKDGKLRLGKTQLSVDIVDPANVAIVQMWMDIEGDGEDTFNVDFDALIKALGVASGENVLVQKVDSKLHVVVGNHVMKITELSMLSSNVKKVPQLKYECVVTVEAKELLGMWAGLAKVLNDKVNFIIDHGTLLVNVEGTILDDTLTLPVEWDGYEKTCIPSDYLEDLAKGLKSRVDEITLEVRTDSPLLIEATYGGTRIKVMIAPRIVQD